MSAARAAALVLALQVSASPAAAGADLYTARIDADLQTLSVGACTAGSPLSLEARDPRAARFLLSARVRGAADVISAADGRLMLPRGAGCVDYVVDLAGAAAANPRYRELGRTNRAVSTSLWLWRPRGPGKLPLEVRFELAPGTQVSVPWQAVAGDADGRPRFRVPPSPESDDGVSAFGRFAPCALALGGSTLRVAVLDGRHPGRTDELFTWIARAAANVALTYGRFPHPSPQVLVIPVAAGPGDTREPVPFGHVIRDGGEAVEFFVNQQRPLADFVADWTATHEFAHLLIPYVASNEKWISEGLASYYQNVLMARGGAYTAEQAWRKIIEGFRRGEASVPHLSLEQAMPLGSWDGIMKTYWGGAAVLLMADVELRQHSGGRDSLDSALQALQACCLPSPRIWDGRRLFRKLDRLTGRAVFERLYDRYRGQRAFPDTGELLAGLGVGFESGRVRFDDGADLSAIRRAITAPPAGAPVAPTSARCAAD